MAYQADDAALGDRDRGGPGPHPRRICDQDAQARVAGGAGQARRSSPTDRDQSARCARQHARGRPREAAGELRGGAKRPARSRADDRGPDSQDRGPLDRGQEGSLRPRAGGRGDVADVRAAGAGIGRRERAQSKIAKRDRERARAERWTRLTRGIGCRATRRDRHSQDQDQGAGPDHRSSTGHRRQGRLGEWGNGRSRGGGAGEGVGATHRATNPERRSSRGDRAAQGGNRGVRARCRG